MPNSSTPSTLIQPGAKTLGGTSPDAATATTVVLPTVTVPNPTPLILTKFQFRKLFTTAERVIIDNIQFSSNFSTAVKFTVTTMQKDLENSGDVDLHLIDVVQGVTFLYQIGILTQVRMNRILANLPPL